jgi:hypothetical protein
VLRRSYREGGKVRHENLGNLSHLPIEVIEAIRKMLAGRVLVDLDEQLQIESSLAHGHVAAVLGVLRELDLERLLSRERCRERVRRTAMVCGSGSQASGLQTSQQRPVGSPGRESPKWSSRVRRRQVDENAYASIAL